MKIDFSKELINYTGEPLMENGQVITLGKVCCNALSNLGAGEENLPGEEKVKRFNLAVAVYAAKEPLDMKVEDVALIKGLIGKMFGPVVVGPCFNVLEGWK